MPVADPGEGPGGPAPLIFKPNLGPKGRKKKFSGDRPPLSQGLDPAMHGRQLGSFTVNGDFLCNRTFLSQLMDI